MLSHTSGLALDETKDALADNRPQTHTYFLAEREITSLIHESLPIANTVLTPFDELEHELVYNGPTESIEDDLRIPRALKNPSLREEYAEAQRKIKILQTRLPPQWAEGEHDWVELAAAQQAEFQKVAAKKYVNSARQKAVPLSSENFSKQFTLTHSTEYFEKWRGEKMGLNKAGTQVLNTIIQEARNVKKYEFILADLKAELKDGIALSKKQHAAATKALKAVEAKSTQQKRKAPASDIAASSKKAKTAAPPLESKLSLNPSILEAGAYFHEEVQPVAKNLYEMLASNPKYTQLIRLLMSPASKLTDVMNFFQSKEHSYFRDVPSRNAYSSLKTERYSEYGFTPLMWAAKYCHDAEILQYLLKFMDRAAKVVKKDNKKHGGQTALEIANAYSNTIFTEIYAQMLAPQSISTSALLLQRMPPVEPIATPATSQDAVQPPVVALGVDELGIESKLEQTGAMRRR